MANYRNKFHTILEDENDKRYPRNHVFAAGDLNGKKTKEYMVLKEAGANGQDVGPEIRFQPEEKIDNLT